MDVLESIIDAQEELLDRGYRADLLVIGVGVYSELLKESSYTCGMNGDQRNAGKVLGNDVLLCSPMEEDAAVLTATNGHQEAAIIGENTPYYYKDASLKFYP